MVYLKAWYQDVVRQKQVPSDDLATVLDHGPIYRLAMLGEFGPDITQSPLYVRWWETMLNQWAGVLDMIIWLDTRDAVLLERIHIRNHRHVIKGKSEQEACDFLARYRRSYEGIITKMTTDNGPVLLCFDTSQASLDRIVDEVLSEIDSKLTKN
jgi:deoxyadenosine/deoxycytidine kinase